MKAAFALAGLALLASSGARSKWGGARAKQRQTTQQHITKIRVLGTIRELPKPGMFCLYDTKDDVTDPFIEEEFTFRPLACFKTFSEALGIPEESVPTVQGVNSRGTPRKILCQSDKPIGDSGLRKRAGRFDVASISGTGCFNRTFPDGAELWDYGPDEVEKYSFGRPSKVPDPEPLA